MYTKYVGINSKTGEKVVFGRQWGSKVFTDVECEQLANGETISFRHTTKDGKEGLMRGKLVKKSFVDQTNTVHEYTKFEPLFAQSYVPDSYCGVTFTEDERKALADGQPVSKTNFVSRHGHTFAATVIFENGRIHAKFDNKENNNMTNKEVRSFADDLFNASNNLNKVTPDEVTPSAKRPSLIDGHKDFSKVKLIKTEVLLDQVKLTYSNNVIVTITNEDCDLYKDVIELSTLDEVIREYALDVDSSLIEN